MGFRWDPLKNEALRRTRGKSFEEIVNASFVAVGSHPTRPNQKLLYFALDGYIWVVPCVRRGDEIFLKTAFRSRKHTKLWLNGGLG